MDFVIVTQRMDAKTDDVYFCSYITAL